MATVGDQYTTLSDLANRLDPSGAQATLIEQAAYSNNFNEDALVIEGNKPDGHLHNIRTGYPRPTWRVLHGGVEPTKTTTTTKTDTAGIMEDFTKVDEHLADMAPSKKSYRAQEDAGKFHGFTQEWQDKFFYGDTSLNPEEVMGMAPRYSALTGTGAGTWDNVFSNGGSGSDNCSIWLITWHKDAAFSFYGKGTTGGLQHKDLGLQQTAATVGGGEFMAWVSWMKWQMGVALGDYRYCGRICNIDASVRDAGSGAGWDDIRENLIRLVNCTPTRQLPGSRTYMYMNKATRTALEIRSSNPQAGMAFSQMDYFGKRVDSIFSTPVRLTDSLNDIEGTIS